MKEAEMRQIARLIRRVAIDGEPAPKIAGEIAEFLTGFYDIRYSFDD